MFNKNSKRQKQRDFYKKTQTNLNSKRKDIDKISLTPRRTTPQSVWFYKAPPIIISVVSFIVLCVILQGLTMAWHNIGSKEPKGYWSNFGVIPYFFLFIPVCLILYSFSLRKAKAVWHNNNEHLISDDLEEYTNDSYVRTMDHLSQELMVAPDADFRGMEDLIAFKAVSALASPTAYHSGIAIGNSFLAAFDYNPYTKSVVIALDISVVGSLHPKHP